MKENKVGTDKVFIALFQTFCTNTAVKIVQLMFLICISRLGDRPPPSHIGHKGNIWYKGMHVFNRKGRLSCISVFCIPASLSVVP